MSLNNNAIKTRNQEREKAFKLFRYTYSKLDKVIEALYHSSLYTCKEYEELATQYNILQLRADRMEEDIRKRFPAKDLDSTIKWMKSNYKEDDKEEDLSN